jgi:hypothetical protein
MALKNKFQVNIINTGIIPKSIKFSADPDKTKYLSVSCNIQLAYRKDIV